VRGRGPGCGARTLPLAVNVLAVPDSDHDDLRDSILDGVNDAVPSDANPISVVLAGKLLGSLWPGIFAESTNGVYDSLSVRFLIDGLDLLGRRGFDQDPITSHAV
jgi:hypothetical protein